MLKVSVFWMTLLFSPYIPVFQMRDTTDPEMLVFIYQSLWSHVPEDRVVTYYVACMLLCCDIVYFDNRLVPVLLSSVPLTRHVLICQRNLYLRKRLEQLLMMTWSRTRLWGVALQNQHLERMLLKAKWVCQYFICKVVCNKACLYFMKKELHVHSLDQIFFRHNVKCS